MSGVDVEQTMARVEAELARRPAWQRRVGETSTPVVENNAGFKQRAEYTLHDLLHDADEAFVRTAYLAVLKREADPVGLEDHLQKLRCGQLTRIEVLAALRWSPEGREKGVHVDGLLLPTLLHRWRRIPVVGPLVAWLHGLARLGSLNHRLEAQGAAQARSLSAAVERLRCFEASSRDVLAGLSTSLQALQSDAREVRARSDELDAAFEGARREFDSSLERILGGMAAVLEGTRNELDSRVERAQGEMRVALERAQDKFDRASESLATGLAQGRIDLDTLLAESRLQQERDRLASERLRALDPLYVAFEQRFRGESGVIRARALPYLDILRDAQVGTSNIPVLDLGCGNGDWLEVMREHGFVARGIDSNRVFVDACRQRGLDVIEGDAIAYLESLPAGSLGGVTGMHIAEHLPFEVLVRLIDESLRVLCVGGVLALETPNPENLLVGSHYFYMDPTHRSPLPPEALRWLVEARGFQMCRIERWTVAREMDVPAPLPPEQPAATAVNRVLDLLRMAPDYAVIARRL